MRPVVGVLLLLGVAVPADPCVAQSTERRYEAFATGAVVTIHPDEVADGATDAVDLLQWNVPGMVVTRWPNGAVSLQIRHNADCAPPGNALPGPEPGEIPNPLLIVDGVPVSVQNVSWELLALDPFRIERIDVVKDWASAAIYGARAACGVILVFTRRRP